MYLGEIVRRVLAKMAQEHDLFGHSFADKLAQPFVLRQALHVPTSETQIIPPFQNSVLV
jgi:hexokinase